jgi:hypothetical protein
MSISGITLGKLSVECLCTDLLSVTICRLLSAPLSVSAVESRAVVHSALAAVATAPAPVPACA